jgi:hypothetical protein
MSERPTHVDLAKRCVIYARYSTDEQNITSIETQIAQCEKRIKAEGWRVVDVFRTRESAAPPPATGVSTTACTSQPARGGSTSCW